MPSILPLMTVALMVLSSVQLNAAIAPELPPGGANAPQPSAPPELVIALRELPLGTGAVRIPHGSYTAPPEGAPTYGVPGPLAAFRGSDGLWRGHGYLETWTPLQSFSGSVEVGDNGRWTAHLDYRFADQRQYVVNLSSDGQRLFINEDSQLGLRDVWVIDCYAQWQPTAALVFDGSGQRHAARYLPCHYDATAASIRHSALLDPELSDRAAGGLAVLSPQAEIPLVLGLWARDLGQWAQGDRLSVELWQRRQLPGDPASRHFQGPETKSDGTPNPHTAALIGESRYEGHVTIELRLGTGSRRLGFAIFDRPQDLKDLPAAFRDHHHE